MGRGRPVGSVVVPTREEVEACMECVLPDCWFSSFGGARRFWKRTGEAPCEYWRVKWKRTGWVKKQEEKRESWRVERAVAACIAEAR